MISMFRTLPRTIPLAVLSALIALAAMVSWTPADPDTVAAPALAQGATIGAWFTADTSTDAVPCTDTLMSTDYCDLQIRVVSTFTNATTITVTASDGLAGQYDQRSRFTTPANTDCNSRDSVFPCSFTVPANDSDGSELLLGLRIRPLFTKANWTHGEITVHHGENTSGEPLREWTLNLGPAPHDRCAPYWADGYNCFSVEEGETVRYQPSFSQFDLPKRDILPTFVVPSGIHVALSKDGQSYAQGLQYQHAYGDGKPQYQIYVHGRFVRDAPAKLYWLYPGYTLLPGATIDRDRWHVPKEIFAYVFVVPRPNPTGPRIMVSDAPTVEAGQPLRFDVTVDAKAEEDIVLAYTVVWAQYTNTRSWPISTPYVLSDPAVASAAEFTIPKGTQPGAVTTIILPTDKWYHESPRVDARLLAWPKSAYGQLRRGDARGRIANDQSVHLYYRRVTATEERKRWPSNAFLLTTQAYVPRSFTTRWIIEPLTAELADFDLRWNRGTTVDEMNNRITFLRDVSAATYDSWGRPGHLLWMIAAKDQLLEGDEWFKITPAIDDEHVQIHHPRGHLRYGVILADAAKSDPSYTLQITSLIEGGSAEYQVDFEPKVSTTIPAGQKALVRLSVDDPDHAGLIAITPSEVVIAAGAAPANIPTVTIQSAANSIDEDQAIVINRRVIIAVDPQNSGAACEPAGDNVVFVLYDDGSGNPPPGMQSAPVQISRQQGELSTGSGFSYEVTLTEQPSVGEAVSVSMLSTQPDAVPAPAALEFSDVNWNQPQEVTLNANADVLGEGQERVSIVHMVEGQHGPTIGPVLALSVGDPLPELGLIAVPSALSLHESDVSDTYWLRLAAQPTEDVTVSIVADDTSGANYTLSKTELTFTSANWYHYQSVQVSPVDDADATDHPIRIEHTAEGYQVTGGSISGVVLDDDQPVVTATQEQSGKLIIGPDKQTGPYRVRVSPCDVDVSRDLCTLAQAGESVDITLSLEDESVLSEGDRISIRFATSGGKGSISPTSGQWTYGDSGPKTFSFTVPNDAEHNDLSGFLIILGTVHQGTDAEINAGQLSGWYFVRTEAAP